MSGRWKKCKTMEGIELDYYVGKDNIIKPCQYILRLEDSLNNPNINSLSIIENKLDSIIDYEVKEIEDITKKTKNAMSSFIYNSNKYSVKDIYNISKIIGKDLELFGKKLVNLRQMKSIKIYGLDEDKVTELQDIINDHKILLMDSLNELGKEYKKLLDESSSSFNNLNNNKKNQIIEILKNSINKKDIDINYIENSNILTENNLLDIIWGVISTPIKWGLSTFITYWKEIILLIGFDAVTGNLIFKTLGELITNTSGFFGGIFNMIVFSTIFIFGCLLAIKIYHSIYDNYYKDKNKELNIKLDQANLYAKSENSKKITYSVEDGHNKEETKTFRGFNNTASYRPEGSSTEFKEDPRYTVF